MKISWKIFWSNYQSCGRSVYENIAQHKLIFKQVAKNNKHQNPSFLKLVSDDQKPKRRSFIPIIHYDHDDDDLIAGDHDDDDDLGAGDKELTFLNLPLTRWPTPCLALTDLIDAASLESLFLRRQFIGSPIVACRPPSLKGSDARRRRESPRS